MRVSVVHFGAILAAVIFSVVLPNGIRHFPSSTARSDSCMSHFCVKFPTFLTITHKNLQISKKSCTFAAAKDNWGPRWTPTKCIRWGKRSVRREFIEAVSATRIKP